MKHTSDVCSAVDAFQLSSEQPRAPLGKRTGQFATGNGGQDISAGDEIFSDYLFYTLASAEAFYKESQVLKRICNGDEVGLITKNER